MKLKLIYTAIWASVCPSLLAQTDTIQVSRDYKTILVLPTAFDFSINGKELNFLESFPKNTASKKAERIVLLSYNDVAPDTSDHTNYTLYTRDGLAYDFILKLVDIPVQKRWSLTTYMADNLDSLGEAHQVSEGTGSTYATQNENLAGPGPNRTIVENSAEPPLEGTIPDSIPLTKELYARDRMEYIRRRCFYNQFNKGKVFRYVAKSGDVFLWLENIYYENNEIYLQFRLENKENIDYDVNFLKFGIASNYGKSTGNMRTDHEPLFRYKVPKKVEGNSENHFFVVFDKFTLDRKKLLVVDLDEEQGNRNLSMEIDHTVINHPMTFK